MVIIIVLQYSITLNNSVGLAVCLLSAYYYTLACSAQAKGPCTLLRFSQKIFLKKSLRNSLPVYKLLKNSLQL